MIVINPVTKFGLCTRPVRPDLPSSIQPTRGHLVNHIPSSHITANEGVAVGRHGHLINTGWTEARWV